MTTITEKLTEIETRANDLLMLSKALQVAVEALCGISYGTLINPDDRARSAIDEIIKVLCVEKK